MAQPVIQNVSRDFYMIDLTALYHLRSDGKRFRIVNFLYLVNIDNIRVVV